MNYGERPVHFGCQLKSLDNSCQMWFDASRMNWHRGSVRLLSLCVASGIVGFACEGTDPLVSTPASVENRTVTVSDLASECPNLPTNQKGTLMAPVRSGFPLQVQVDPNLSADLRQAITWALQSWNQFSRSQVGYSFFVETNWDYSIQDDRPSSSGDCSFDRPDSSGFRVFEVESLAEWQQLGFSESNPAATLRCQSKGKLTRQVIGIYPPSMRSTQLKSVVLHELGHALGLDHSCKLSSGSENFVSCADIPAGHPYRIAAMYPTLRVAGKNSAPSGSVSTSTDEVKEMLQENDRSRASCLYSVGDRGGQSK